MLDASPLSPCYQALVVWRRASARLPRMRFVQLLATTMFALFPLSCALESQPAGSSTISPGVYGGNVAISDIQHQDGVFFFAQTDLASSGAVTGTAETIAPTKRETGTVSGTILPASGPNTNTSTIDVDLTFTFPTLGSFRARGRGVHSGSTKEVGFSALRTVDKNGALYGEATGILKSQ